MPVPSFRLAARTAGGLAACAWLLGCAPSRGVPVPGATLVVGVAQPRGSSATPDSSLARVAALLERASPLRLEQDGRVTPWLAERVDVSADGRRCTIHLRAGLTFHDGTALDSASVAEVIRRDGPATPASAGSVNPGLLDVDVVRTPDARTIEIALRAPNSMLGEALAQLDVRSGSTDAAAGAYARTASRPGAIDMRAFGAYLRGTPGLDPVELRSYDSPRTAWAALLRGEIGFLYELTPEAIPFVESDGDVQVHRFLRPFVYVAGLNLRHDVLRHASVRRALSLAVDREGLVHRVLGGRGRAASDPVWPLHWTVADRPPPPATRDVPAARHLLAAARAEATAARWPGEGSRPGVRLVLTALVPAGMPVLERLSLALQRDLLDAGVDLRLEALPLRAMAARIAAGQFDAYLLDMNAYGLCWTYWLWHSTASRALVNAGASPADAWLDRVRRARGDEELRRAVTDLQRAFRDDPPGLFLCWAEAARATRRSIALPSTPDRDVLLTLPSWHPAPTAN